jgi:DHA1 family bicyclomycin/chloramphenicol resistance-like MFS transporter
VLTLAGLLVTAIIALGLAESHRAPDRRALAAGRLVGNFARALGSRACFGNALLNCLSFGGLFAYISASPLLLMGQLGASARLYGVLFAVTSGAIMAGAALNGRLARRHVAPGKPLGVGLGLAAASAVALLGVTLSGHLALAALLPLLIVNTFAFGLVAPNAAHAAIEPMPDIAGVAAAVVGFLQMFLGGALGSAVVAWLYPWLGASAITASMTGFALAALGCSAWVTRRPAYLPGVVTM